MQWNDLNMSQRSQLMRIFIENGITDLSEMQNMYNNGGGFRKWRRKMSKYKDIDMKNDPDYDYKGFFKDNPDYAWSMLEDDPKAHFSDKFKRPSHPTFSDESIYSQQYQQGIGNPDWVQYPMGGYWDKDDRGNDIFYHSYFTSSTPEKIKRTADYIRMNEKPGVRAMYQPDVDEKTLPQINIEDYPEYSPTQIHAINLGLQYIPKSQQEQLTKFDSIDNKRKELILRGGQDYNENVLAKPILTDKELSKAVNLRNNSKMTEQVLGYYNEFLKAGYTPIQAAAILGNALQENDTMVYNRVGKNKAYGIYQMEKEERRKYDKWLRKNGLVDNGLNQTKYIASVYDITSEDALTPEDINYGDINTSTIYTTYEEAPKVYGGYSRAKAQEDWNSENLGNATKAFMATYEKPGNPMLQKRMHYANEIYKLYYGQ